jgi:DNA primase
MGLETYHRKRDFKKTSQPEGRGARRERRRSAPLDWAEVRRKKVTPQDFTIENMRKRIERKGDLFSPVLKLKQRLEAGAL